MLPTVSGLRQTSTTASTPAATAKASKPSTGRTGPYEGLLAMAALSITEVRSCHPATLMRLVLVTQDFPPARGGIQTWALEIARRLSRRCEKFAVIAPAAEHSETADAALGFRVIRTGTANTLVLTSAPALARLATREGFDRTLHAQWSTAPAARALRRFGKIKKVTIAAHGRELLLAPWARVGAAQRGYDSVRRRELAEADCVLAGSRYTAGLARDLGASAARVLVTRYGTDPERFRPRDAAPLRARLELGARPVLLTIARLVPRKGIDDVLGALVSVRRSIPDVAYVIAGSGPDRDAARKYRPSGGSRELGALRGCGRGRRTSDVVLARRRLRDAVAQRTAGRSRDSASSFSKPRRVSVRSSPRAPGASRTR